MKPQSAKAKGRTLCKWVKGKLLGVAWTELDDKDIHVTSSGAGGEDLVLSPLAREYFNLQFECKNLARFVGYKWYEQARSHGDREPVVIIKANGKKPLAIIDADVLIGLYYVRKCKK